MDLHERIAQVLIRSAVSGWPSCSGRWPEDGRPHKLRLCLRVVLQIPPRLMQALIAEQAQAVGWPVDLFERDAVYKPLLGKRCINACMGASLRCALAFEPYSIYPFYAACALRPIPLGDPFSVSLPSASAQTTGMSAASS